MVTREDIEALEEESIQAGDEGQTMLCRLALSPGGYDSRSWYLCEEAITNGRG